MLTKIEIDGFKSFSKFSLDLSPFTVIVGPNASGKSNLFDALQLLSAVSEFDIYTAIQGLRGEPDEIFRRTTNGSSRKITFAIEVYLGSQGMDDFGRTYTVPSQRLRYELQLSLLEGRESSARGVFVDYEFCRSLKRAEDTAAYLQALRPNYGRLATPFIRPNDERDGLLIRQDGPGKSGSPMRLPLREASRTALSTITTAEFPHLYALRKALRSLKFLEINPSSARLANDRFEKTSLKPDASNLAAVLNRLRDQTRTTKRPNGVLSDIASDLTSLIPSVRNIRVQDEEQKQYSFSVDFSGDLSFSSRVISDGTLRLLALLTVLNDPDRRGTLLFEEPENGIHEGRVPDLIELIRESTAVDPSSSSPTFQVLMNTHSPRVMSSLKDKEIVAADTVTTVSPHQNNSSTRMRTGVQPSSDLFDPSRHLVRAEIDKLLQRSGEAG